MKELASLTVLNAPNIVLRCEKWLSDSSSDTLLSIPDYAFIATIALRAVAVEHV